jgi:hypothetical protein
LKPSQSSSKTDDKNETAPAAGLVEISTGKTFWILMVLFLITVMLNNQWISAVNPPQKIFQSYHYQIKTTT